MKNIKLLGCLVCLSVSLSMFGIVAYAEENVHCNATLQYADTYYERVMQRNNTLKIPMSFANVGNDEEHIVYYIAQYDSLGKLLDLELGTTIVVPANQTVTTQAMVTFDNSLVNSVKVLVWENGNLRPIIDAISLNAQNADYYANNITSCQTYDISKMIIGNINTSTDVDYIKFIPNTSGKYVISATSSNTVTGNLYNAQGILIKSGISFDGGYYIKEALSADTTYYLETSGTAVFGYSIIANIVDNNETIVFSNNSIYFEQNYIGTDSVNVKLLNSAGTVLQSVNVTPENNKISAELNIATIPLSEYRIIVLHDNYVVSSYDVDVSNAEQSFNLLANEYISIPVSVSNATDLSDICFSVSFDDNKFDVYDVCEQTYANAETGTGIISSAEVNIKALKNNAVAFESTRDLTQTWNGTVNTVKLQVLTDGSQLIKVFTYKVQ